MKHPIRTLLVTATVAGASLIGLTAVGNPVEAAGCISKAEYKTLTKGMTPGQVFLRTGAKGEITYDFDGNYVDYQSREYRACGSGGWGWVDVDFDNDHAVRHNRLGLCLKSAYWA
jgi:hypothetical protein